MENVINFLNGFNVQTILSMTFILWLFIRELKSDIKKEIEEIKKEGGIQADRIDKIYQMYCDTQKEIANISKENGDRFYTLLQEIHKK